MRDNFLFFLGVCTAMMLPVSLLSQFAPPAGQPGTTAVYRDSSAIVGWAVNCTIQRGFINMADTTAMYNGVNKASYGSYLYASGPSDEYVVSLGDHGSATLGFNPPVRNNIGPDFAVFENSFGDLFLELAFVEVSSDGVHFYRIPAISLIPEDNQITTFGTIDATLINNLAGKYRMGYGTPFDLEDLQGQPGLDLNNITHIRVIDVGGCVDSPFATFDSQGHKINDPWPTPFDTGGFDLDAIGILNIGASTTRYNNPVPAVKVFPNPVKNFLTIESGSKSKFRAEILNLDGVILKVVSNQTKVIFDMSEFSRGLYFAHLSFDNGTSVSCKIVKD